MQVRHDRHVRPDRLGSILQGREVVEVENLRLERA
jgi:hypothetical protein